jgi:hypothetical protein
MLTLDQAALLESPRSQLLLLRYYLWVTTPKGPW